MDKMEVIARLRKLRSMYENGTEAESLIAADKMQDLMDRYRLTMSDLEIRQETVITELVKRPLKERLAPADWVWSGIEQYCGIRHYYKWQDGTRFAAVMGFRHEVTMAIYLYEIICHAIERATVEFKKSDDYSSLLTAVDRRNATQTFQDAMAMRIDDRLGEMAKQHDVVAKTGSGTDLVVLRNALVLEEYNKIEFGGKLSHVKHKLSATAINAGREAGDRVHLSRPLTAERREAIDTNKKVLSCPECICKVAVPTDRGTIRIKCPEGHQWIWTPA